MSPRESHFLYFFFLFFLQGVSVHVCIFAPSKQTLSTNQKLCGVSHTQHERVCLHDRKIYLSFKVFQRCFGFTNNRMWADHANTIMRDFGTENHNIDIWTRMHSSRMRTVRSLTVSSYLVVSAASRPPPHMHAPCHARPPALHAPTLLTDRHL